MRRGEGQVRSERHGNGSCKASKAAGVPVGFALSEMGSLGRNREGMEIEGCLWLSSGEHRRQSGSREPERDHHSDNKTHSYRHHHCIHRNPVQFRQSAQGPIVLTINNIVITPPAV